MAEQSTGTIGAIIKEADRIEEDTLYSAKSQWETARELGWLHLALGIPATITAAVAGISIVSDDKVIGAIFAGASAVMTALLTFLDPKSKANAHRQAGGIFKAISNDARVFREVTCQGATPVSELEAMLGKLNQRRNDGNASAPQPTRWAFARARKGIEKGEAKYRADSTRRRGGAQPPAAT
jgi:hypothetical protein